MALGACACRAALVAFWHGAASGSALTGRAGFVLLGRSAAPRVARGAAGARHASRLLRRASEEEELQALLAQAEALRQEAAAEEQELSVQRGEREAEEAKKAEEDTRRKEEEAALAKKEAEQRSLVAAAKLSIAEGNLRKAEAEGVDGEALEKIRAELVEAQRLAAAAQPAGAPAQAAPGPQAQAPAPAPDLVRRAPGEMSEAEWADLASRFPSMGLQEQFNTNKKLGPQGRRKLNAMMKGEKGGVFIVPGAVVTIKRDPARLRRCFGRFRNDPVNGYSDQKMSRRGQDCRVRATFQDGTLTCEFADGVKLDFPWEAVQDYDASGAFFA